MLKVEKFGESLIKITETDENEVIYDGTNDVDCIIEAFGFYCDKDVEFEEKEMPEGLDPIKEYDTSSLSKDQEIELSDEPLNEGENGEGGDKRMVTIQIDNGKDYPNDDYDEEGE